MGESITPAELFPAEPIRLAEISVHNWGTFAGCHTARVSPDGTLITGETGAGKSSLIDATQLLYLQRNKVVFNTAAAQAARDDRTLLSYVRGKFKHDEAEEGVGYGGYSRRQATVSAVRGLYCCGTVEFTLIAIFWVTGATTAQKEINNQYIIADENLPLHEVLQNFAKLDRRALKHAYKDRPAVVFYDDFEGYRVKYQQKLFFENLNAPGLLTRALGLKKIEDLTHLIQNFVLDAGNVRDIAADAVRGFRDLETVHAQLLDTRERALYLQELPGVRDQLRAAADELTKLEQARKALPIYLAREWTRLLSERLAKQITDHTAKRYVLEQAEQRKAAADAHAELMHKLYVEAGGGAIETLEVEHASAMGTLQEAQTAERHYVALISALGFPALVTPETFASTQQAVAAELVREATTKEDLLNEVVRSGSAKKLVDDEVAQVQRELESAKSRKDSAIDGAYATRRDQLSRDLGIPREQLMFVGELIDVLPEHEKDWRGAIERAVKAKLTLAVPEDEIRRVARWANSNFLGIRFRFQPVTRVPDRPTFRADSYLHKLSWRDHPYRDWVKMLLSHRDLRCVDSPEDCELNPFSLTKEGMIHMRKGDFEKDDRRRVTDDSDWAIGYTNTARIQRLERQLQQLRERRDVADQASAEARNRQRAFDFRAQQLKTLQRVTWSDVDVPGAQAEVARLQLALDRARASGGELAKAKKIFEDAKLARKDADSAWIVVRDTEKALAAAVAKSQTDLARYQPVARTAVNDEILQVAHRIAAVRSEADLDAIDAAEANVTVALEQQVRGAQGRQSTANSNAVGIISGFFQKWKGIAADWRPSIDSIDEYVQHYEQIVAKGLPELVTRFTEMLTRHSTQSLAAVNQQMKNERENIADRIDAINIVLKRTEFRKNSYLQLEARLGKYVLNDEYNEKVTRALGLVTSEDHEARYDALKAAIDILAKATDPTFASSKENTRLLDPRFQFEFVAKEFQHGNLVAQDTWASSAGKSGGEKEIFAGTIVAASLAYVLTPAGAEKPVFCTVFLDEAFSNTSAVYSRRVLKTFRELRLHLNLITPFKNIELARDCARLLVLVRKDENHNTSSLSEITWEYIDQRARQRAAALGIKVEARV